MASLTKKYSKEKLKGQIFTPFFIVDKILDDVQYNSPNILGKTIIDPACGDGRFLIKIVERIIKYSPAEELASNLSKVYGWDTDNQAVKLAISKLNVLIKPLNIEVNWQIKVQNSLQIIGQKNIPKFDFIVGNPPYIRIQHLAETERKFIQKNFNFCQSGSTDIYIAFYELALQLLRKNGRAAYITPNTFLSTETAKPLRKHFENQQNLLQLSNYGAIQLFDDATTYSAICIFDRNKHQNFLFQSAVDQQHFESRKIGFEEIKDTAFWQLSTVKNTSQKQGKRLGDIADIHVGITTLADKIYILDFVKKEGNCLILSNKEKKQIKLEKNICKAIVKVSTLKNPKERISKYILFPYQKVKGKYQIIPQKKLESDYPLAYKYLLQNKHLLDKRDNGKANKTAWYAFGRSQSLNTGFGEKIVFSPMNKSPNFMLVSHKNATFYSGYCIKYQGDKQKLLKQLNSERMAAFIKVSSRDFRGGWKAYNKKIVQEFIIHD
jgi:type I restriction-modification system DNA methylase subunit